MYNLDEIDKKILYELGKNARLSYKQIARNISSKKEVVAYHIQQLVKKKVITKFVVVIALSKLGIFSGKIYIRLQGLDKEAEQRMYDYLISNPDIVWVAKSVGRWDLLLGMYAKDIVDFSRKKNEILSKFSRYIKDYDITQIEDGVVFNRDYLINNPAVYRKEFIFSGEVEKNALNKEELKLINLIKNNARFQAVDIAKQLNLDARTVINKLKDLQKRGIIQGFTVFIDLKKLGIKFHKLCIYLQNHEKKNIDLLISYLKQYPNTIHLIKSLGSWELEIETENEPNKDIYDFISELKNKFPETIKQIELITIIDELKLEFFPKELIL